MTVKQATNQINGMFANGIVLARFPEELQEILQELESTEAELEVLRFALPKVFMLGYECKTEELLKKVNRLRKTISNIS